jgi:membrane fusion protein (multidrug efflux system)
MARAEVTEMTARRGLSEGSERFMLRRDRIEMLQEAPKAKAPPTTKSPPATPAESTPAAVSVAPQHRRPSLRVVLMAAGIFTVVIGATLFWLRGGRYATTDDAYMQAAKVLVTTDVSGIVSSVNVREGQPVKAGDLLFQIDSSQFQIALDNAQANLHEVALTIESMKSNYQVTLSNVAAQQAQVGLDQVTFDRDAVLVSSDSVARETYDQARYSLQLDKSKLVSLQQQAQVELAKLDGNPNIPVTEHPLYQQAKAQVDEAQRQLGHTSVRAPFAGVVTQVDALQPGTYLVSQTAAMTETGAIALVADNQAWVTAQMKETDLTYVKPGNHVDITVDTYPGQVWSGTVESVSPASSSEFSVLPAQNSSGNWVKVVQRVPVRIGITRKPGAAVLRSGMSVYVSIDTGHRRSLGDLL